MLIFVNYIFRIRHEPQKNSKKFVSGTLPGLRYLLSIKGLLSLEYGYEVIELRGREGVPLDRAVCIVPQNKFAIPVCHTRLQNYLKRFVFFKESATCGKERGREGGREREREGDRERGREGERGRDRRKESLRLTVKKTCRY